MTLDTLILNIGLIRPEIVLAIGGMLLLMLGVFCKERACQTVTVGAVMLTVLALIAVGKTAGFSATAFSGMLVVNNFTYVLKTVLLAGLLISLLLSVRALSLEKIDRFEVPVLLVFSTLGMLLMVSSNDLLSLYMGLELQSLALYVLASIRRDDTKSSEAGVKYFVLGALSSGMLLFGASLVYGFIGSTSFDVIANTLSVGAPSAGLVVGLVFIMAGLVFKVSAVPFHMWTPDVYQGAPTIITAFFATVPKLAALALLIRVLIGPFGTLSAEWFQIIAFVCVASMLLGSFAGIAQSSTKRLLAYSSIANVGFILVGLATQSQTGISAALFYMIIYMITTAGTFAVLLTLRLNEEGVDKISDLSGLSKTHPFQAYSLALMMFSVAGIPPLAGFFAKYAVFQAALSQGLVLITVIGLLASVVSAFYYLRLIKIMFFDEPKPSVVCADLPGAKIVMGLSVLFTLIFILDPGVLLSITQAAAKSLFFG